MTNHLELGASFSPVRRCRRTSSTTATNGAVLCSTGPTGSLSTTLMKFPGSNQMAEFCQYSSTFFPAGTLLGLPSGNPDNPSLFGREWIAADRGAPSAGGPITTRKAFSQKIRWMETYEPSKRQLVGKGFS